MQSLLIRNTGFFKIVDTFFSSNLQLFACDLWHSIGVQEHRPDSCTVSGFPASPSRWGLVPGCFQYRFPVAQYLLILTGKRNARIAQQLNISHKTVSTYKTRIFKKLNIENDAQLVVYAYKHEAGPGMC
jgi:hypothetical protein